MAPIKSVVNRKKEVRMLFNRSTAQGKFLLFTLRVPVGKSKFYNK